jgi:hypothetical protein
LVELSPDENFLWLIKKLFYLVSRFQGFIQLLAHPVMLDGQEGSVQDDAERHGGLDQGRVDDLRKINFKIKIKKAGKF